MDASVCEANILVTRSVAGSGANNVTVSQQAVQLTCGTVYKPTTAEIFEDLTEPGLNVSQAYTYCVQVGWLCHDGSAVKMPSPVCCNL